MKAAKPGSCRLRMSRFLPLKCGKSSRVSTRRIQPAERKPARGTLRGKFLEPPAAMQSDIVVAVGATDLGVPDNVVRSGRTGDVIRPDPAGEWYDLPGARAALGI